MLRSCNTRHGEELVPFRVLIDVARSRANDQPRRANAITSFVIAQMWDIPVPIHARLIYEDLPGEAWLVQGSIPYALADYENALLAALKAERLLEINAALVVERIDARLLRAQALSLVSEDIETSVELMEDCLFAYSELGDIAGCVRVLSAIAVALVVRRPGDNPRPFLEAAASIAKVHNDATLTALVADAVTRAEEYESMAAAAARMTRRSRSRHK
jgi:hypothetical protein